MRLEYGRHGHSTVGIGEYGPPAAEATNGPRREYVGSTKRVRRPRREYGGCGDSTQAIRIVHILYGQCGRSTDERQIVNVPIYTTVFWGSYLAFRSHTEYFRMWLTNEERILLQLTELVLPSQSAYSLRIVSTSICTVSAGICTVSAGICTVSAGIRTVYETSVLFTAPIYVLSPYSFPSTERVRTPQIEYGSWRS